jgi:ribosomal protein L3 glutamine methyltransferase
MDYSFDQINTLSQLLQWVHNRFLQAELYYGHGTDNAWDEAVQLVLFVMGLPVDSDDSVSTLSVSEEHKAKARALLEARVATRKPLAYLIHEAWFMGMRFHVDERVIVPRSPFAEWIDQKFQPWVDEMQVTHILDMCTGSGCMAIAAASVFPQANVDAVDIDNDALDVARLNIETYQLEARVRALQSDGFNQLSHNRYDVIMCNPPYVSGAEMATLPEEYLSEPKHALYAEQQGLSLVIRLLAQAPDYMSPQGILIMEVGNSDELLQNTLPQVPFVWLEQANGGHGLFVLTYEQLQQFQASFRDLDDSQG